MQWGSVPADANGAVQDVSGQKGETLPPDAAAGHKRPRHWLERRRNLSSVERPRAADEPIPANVESQEAVCRARDADPDGINGQLRPIQHAKARFSHRLWFK